MGDYFYQGLSKPASLERSHVSLGLNFVRYPLGVGVKGKLVQGGRLMSLSACSGQAPCLAGEEGGLEGVEDPAGQQTCRQGGRRGGKGLEQASHCLVWTSPTHRAIPG